MHRAVSSISARFTTLAIQLGLPPVTVETVMKDYTTVRECLQMLLLLWLRRNYDTECDGLPSWRMLCAAVASEAGGSDKRLALEIAAQHPCVLEEAIDSTGAVMYTYSSLKVLDHAIHLHWLMRNVRQVFLPQKSRDFAPTSNECESWFRLMCSYSILNCSLSLTELMPLDSGASGLPHHMFNVTFMYAIIIFMFMVTDSHIASCLPNSKQGRI